MTFDELLENYGKLIYKFAHKGNNDDRNTYFEFDDYYQDLCLAAWQSIETYDQSKSDFITHLYWQLMKQKMRTTRDNSRVAETSLKDTNRGWVSYDTPIGEKEDATLFDYIQPKTFIMDNLDIVEFNDELTEKEKEVLFYLKQGYKGKEIADIMDCTKTNVYKLRKQIREKFNREFGYELKV